MEDLHVHDYSDYFEPKPGEDPFEGMTEEEAEEFLRELNEDFEEEHYWSGRF